LAERLRNFSLKAHAPNPSWAFFLRYHFPRLTTHQCLINQRLTSYKRIYKAVNALIDPAVLICCGKAQLERKTQGKTKGAMRKKRPASAQSMRKLP
jgi:hypothetical protein